LLTSNAKLFKYYNRYLRRRRGRKNIAQRKGHKRIIVKMEEKKDRKKEKDKEKKKKNCSRIGQKNVNIIR
jgi:hypothetical protein